MITLKEIITQYGSLNELPAVGDKVLFERGEDSGTFSINLGKVTQIRPEGEFKEPTAIVKGIHAFYPDGVEQTIPWTHTVRISLEAFHEIYWRTLGGSGRGKGETCRRNPCLGCFVG